MRILIWRALPIVFTSFIAGCATSYNPPAPEQGRAVFRPEREQTWTMTLGTGASRVIAQSSSAAGGTGGYAQIENRRDSALGVRTSADALQRGMWSSQGPDLTYWRNIRLPTRAEDVIIFERGRERHRGYRSNWDWGY